MSAWNPCQLDEMALPPCHVLAQFHVNDHKQLSCSLYQRSADMGLGVPFNIASYSMLTHLLATHCGLHAHSFYHHIGDCHVYENHREALKEQLTRVSRPSPRLNILNRRDKIEDYVEDDFEVIGYSHAPAVRMQMSA